MRKVVTQNLSGDPEIAKTQVIYTWEKDEIAYYFCPNFKDVFEVQFTGKRWILPSKWGNDSKIYQYRYIGSSSPNNLQYRGENGISHDNEEVFYTTKEEAIEHGLWYLAKELKLATQEHDRDLAKIMEYAGNLKLRPTIID
jgi:hypothetical protein